MKFYAKILVFALLLHSSYLFAEKVIVLLGPPGVGKGTQSTMLKSVTGYTAFSLGNILRQEKQAETDFAVIYAQAKKSRDVLMLLKFAIMVKQVADSPETNGIILDSWPKTRISLQLAKESVFKENDVLVIELIGDPHVLINRIAKRTVCMNPRCGKSYGDRAPLNERICDCCGSPLIKRACDNHEDFPPRVAKYFSDEQQDMRQAFRDSGYHVHQVNAMRPSDEVHRDIMALMEQHLMRNDIPLETHADEQKIYR